MIKSRIERRFLDFRHEMAESFASDFSKDLWTKFEDGHDIPYGLEMICYFKECNTYEIGISVVDPDGEGTTFQLKDGSVKDPDYVQFLYQFQEKSSKN